MVSRSLTLSMCLESLMAERMAAAKPLSTLRGATASKSHLSLYSFNSPSKPLFTPCTVHNQTMIVTKYNMRFITSVASWSVKLLPCGPSGSSRMKPTSRQSRRASMQTSMKAGTFLIHMANGNVSMK